ncbi:MAG: hypothetical protein PIR02_18835 [Microbacterium enclense]
MTPDRTDANPDENAEHGVLDESGNLDTASITILGSHIAQVSVDLPAASHDDDIDDDVVEDEVPVDEAEIRFENIGQPFTLDGGVDAPALTYVPEPQTSREQAEGDDAHVEHLPTGDIILEPRDETDAAWDEAEHDVHEAELVEDVDADADADRVAESFDAGDPAPSSGEILVAAFEENRIEPQVILSTDEFDPTPFEERVVLSTDEFAPEEAPDRVDEDVPDDGAADEIDDEIGDVPTPEDSPADDESVAGEPAGEEPVVAEAADGVPEAAEPAEDGFVVADPTEEESVVAEVAGEQRATETEEAAADEHENEYDAPDDSDVEHGLDDGHVIDDADADGTQTTDDIAVDEHDENTPHDEHTPRDDAAPDVEISSDDHDAVAGNDDDAEPALTRAPWTARVDEAAVSDESETREAQADSVSDASAEAPAAESAAHDVPSEDVTEVEAPADEAASDDAPTAEVAAEGAPAVAAELASPETDAETDAETGTETEAPVATAAPSSTTGAAVTGAVATTIGAAPTSPAASPDTGAVPTATGSIPRTRAERAATGAIGTVPLTRREIHQADEAARVGRAHALERVRTPGPDTTLTSKRLSAIDDARESPDLLTADRLLDPRQVARPEPEGLWQQLVYSMSGHRINLGDGRRARQRKELDRRIAAPLHGGARFVPVLSRKGGVGKTTVTSLLGMALADARDDRVIAVDANPDRGTLADRVGRPNGRTVRDLVRAHDEVDGYHDVSSIVARDATRLDVLASDSDPRVSEAFSDDDYRQVADVAAHYYSIVLTDTGTGIVHSVMEATLERADSLVVVAGLSVDEARLASETLTWLETNGYADRVRSAIVVLNSARPGTPLVRESELEAHFRTRVQTVIRMPYDPRIAAGSAISFRDLQPETRQAARELAAAVVEGLRAPVAAA